MSTKYLGILALAAMAASFSARAGTVQWDFTSGPMTGTSQAVVLGAFPGNPCAGPGTCGVTPTSGVINGVVDVTNGSVTNFDFSFNGVNYGTNSFSYTNIGGGVTGFGYTTEVGIVPNLSLFEPTGSPFNYGLTGYIDMSSGAPIVNLAVSPGGADLFGAAWFDLVINGTGTQFSLGYTDVEAFQGCLSSGGPLITPTSGSTINPCTMQISSASRGTWTAPELDPNAAASGLTLLLGAVAVIRGRRKIVAS